jgi:hypothetical protein
MLEKNPGLDDPTYLFTEARLGPSVGQGVVSVGN